MKQNNRGMTLVEMIVAFAILGLVSASIFSIMLTGTKTYTKLTTTVKLQQQAQVASSNIERQMVNCNEGITYNGNDTSDTSELYLISEDSSGIKELKVVYHDKTTGQLWLATEANMEEGSNSLVFNLLAENVSKMSVTLYPDSNPTPTTYVRASLTLEFKKIDINGKEIKQTVEKTIALRNRPKSTYTCSLSNYAVSFAANP